MSVRGPDKTDAPEWEVVLTPGERRVIRQGLKKLRYHAEKKLQRNERTGWTPEPGKEDIAKATIETIDGLIARIPFPTPRGPHSALAAREPVDS